jgi:hypothetical protein
MDRQLETTTLKQFSGKHLKELLLKLLVKKFGSISPPSWTLSGSTEGIADAKDPRGSIRRCR